MNEAPPGRLPLHGIRVLDLTMVWAGPAATRLLADMGAEVIKVESARQWDMLRSLHFLGGQTDHWWNKSAYFNHNNRNKYGCTIDLRTPAGRALALRLAAISDIVVENYRADVIAKLGLDYADLRSVRSDIILVSMPSHGKSGPERHHVAYGTNVEQLSGLASISGYAGEAPHKSPIAYGDPNAGAIAAAAALAALHHRRRTGEGQHIEVAQWEALVGTIGEFVIGQQMDGEQPEAIGNRHVSRVQGVYPCLPISVDDDSPASGDQWVAVSSGTDAEFATLSAAIGHPELTGDERFADIVSRRRHHDELDGIITAWTSRRTQQAAAEELQRAGVAAAPVLRLQELMSDKHLRARGFWETTTHAEGGTWDMEGPTWRMSASPAHVRTPAPSFAEHNGYVFRELLGLTDQGLDQLRANGVIADEPNLALHS